MKKFSMAILMAITLGFLAAPVMGEEASVEKGAKLFDDPALGGSANPTKCTDCHIGGEGLEKAGNRENLTEMINMCIQGPLKGQKLGEDSVEMNALKLYIKSL